MSLDFSQIKDISIPQGKVKRIEKDGIPIWIGGTTIIMSPIFQISLTGKQNIAKMKFSNSAHTTNTGSVTSGNITVQYTKYNLNITDSISTYYKVFNYTLDAFCAGFNISRLGNYTGKLIVDVVASNLEFDLRELAEPYTFTITYDNGMPKSVTPSIYGMCYLNGSNPKYLVVTNVRFE